MYHANVKYCYFLLLIIYKQENVYGCFIFEYDLIFILAYALFLVNNLIFHCFLF